MKRLSNIKGKDLKIAVFDIETHNWINPYAVGFYDGETYTQFLGKTCISDFLRFVLRYKYRAYSIFAHNGGRFDFNFLMEVLKTWKYDINLIFQGSRCLQIKVYNQKEGEIHNRKARNNIKFCDSVALLRFSLDDLTKNFNVVHKKLNFMDKQENERDYEYLYGLYKENDKRFHKYLQHDVLGLYEVLMKFNDLVKENKGKMSLTIASTSMKTFQKGYLEKDIKMTNRNLNDEMKIGYYGGRTEIFKMFLDEGSYRCYDINSLYPHVMFNNPFPVSKPNTINNPSKEMIMELDGITKCNVKTPNDLYIPILPYKMQVNKNNKLMFPLGSFTGYWDNMELRKAIELGYKVEPIKMFSFKTEYIFKEYVNNFYKLKQDSVRDTPSYIIAKLMLNSLYGKFAQCQDSESLVKINNVEDMKNYDIVDVFDADSNLYKIRTESNGNFFIPQISIHVTALSRLCLYGYLEQLHNNGYDVAYCDTDSLFTNGFLKTSNKLGDMKKEYDFIRGYFLLPKTYCVVKKEGNKIKAKGYIGEFQKHLTENSFKKALFKKDYSDFSISSDQLKFNTMKTSFVRHKNFVSTDIQKKSIKSVYDKRTILKNYDTKAIII